MICHRIRTFLKIIIGLRHLYNVVTLIDIEKAQLNDNIKNNPKYVETKIKLKRKPKTKYNNVFLHFIAFKIKNIYFN